VSWVLAFAGFAALIILHEFGHFAAAKAVGMRVERFYLFFPPAIAKLTRGETEYGIGAIPLGGFVKITGMNPDEELPPEVAPRAYYHQPVWKRIVVIAAGPAMNLLIAFLVLFVLAFGVQEPSTVAVGDIVRDSPAEAQLRDGDRIVAIDGVRRGGGSPEAQAERLAATFESFQCAGGPTDGCRASEAATVLIRRDGRLERLRMRPYYDGEADRFRLGFSFVGAEFVPVDPSASDAAQRAADFMWEVTTRTVGVVARIFDAEERKEISSVVGGYEVTRQAIEFDSRRALTLIAVVSLSLAIINLFPFLPLDGGHIFWSLVEKVRGRPVPFSVMERAGVLGFVLVLMLFAVGLSNDIDRLTGEGFNVR
jgi:regulator of sigma E protease